MCVCVVNLGIYPPQMKVYELRELSLKFERHLVSEIVNFQVIYRFAIHKFMLMELSVNRLNAYFLLLEC